VGGFLVIVVLLVAGWLLLVVPSRRRRASHSAMQDSVEVGDEVITAGGIHGFVRSAEAEVVELEIAPAVVVKLDRRAIAAVATEVEVEPDEEPEAAVEPENTAEPR
jgi:preprotein translocase subunit YajC